MQVNEYGFVLYHKNRFFDYSFFFHQYTGYVCATYLFASLINEMETTAIVERMNMAASLFLVSIRFYLSVFNDWWIEGRFNDWCGEFLIEKRSVLSLCFLCVLVVKYSIQTNKLNSILLYSAQIRTE